MSEFFGTPLVGDVRVPDAAYAVAVIVHGLGEHRGRYGRAVARLDSANIASVVYDQRGHGDSPGDRTDIDDFSTFSNDLARIVEGVEFEFSDVPLFMWGHSMGSLVLLDFVIRSQHRLAGAITSGCPVARFSSPLFALAGPLASLARRTSGPRLPSRLDPVMLTHCPEVMQEYRDDPKVVRSITWRLLLQMARASREILRRAHEVQTPWLTAHGGDDDIAPPGGSRRLHGRLGSQDKQLVVFDGLRHEIHNEMPEAAAEFYDLCVNWIRERTRTQ